MTQNAQRRPPVRRGAVQRLVGLAAPVTLALGIALLGAAPAHASAAVDKMIEQAGKMLREGETAQAVRLLEGARVAEPENPDAHLLYQEAAALTLGSEAVLTDYRQKALAAADDPFFQFLHYRLLAPEKAVAKWKTLCLKHKTSPWPFAGHARTLEKLGKFSEAMGLHDQAIALSPTGSVRFRAFQAYGLERASQWEGAASAWRQVLAAKPGDRAAHLGLGEALRLTGDIDGAIAEFDALIKKDLNDVEARYRRGLALITGERFEDATQEVDALLQTQRGMVLGLCLGAEAALRKSVHEAAKKHLAPEQSALEPALRYAERAVAASPESPYAHFALGAVLEVNGESNPDVLDTAIEQYNETLDLIPFPGPEKVRALVAKAYVLLRVANWEDAIGTADKALEMDSKCLPAMLHAAHGLVAMSQAETAIKKYYTPALKVAPTDGRVHHGLGTAWWDIQKHQKAKKSLEAAVKFEPNSGLYRLSLGELYYELRRYKDAIKELFEATELRPKDPTAWSAYARACTADKHYREAAEAYEHVLGVLQEGDDEKVEIYLYLAILYDRMKDSEKAREAARTFEELGGYDENVKAFIERLLEEK